MQVLSYDITFHSNEWLPTGFPSHSWCKCQVTPDSDYVIHNDVWKQITLTLNNFASQVNVSWIKVYVDICIRKQRYAFMFCSNESSFWHTLVIQTYSLSTWKSTEIVSVIEAIVPACLWKGIVMATAMLIKPEEEVTSTLIIPLMCVSIRLPSICLL